MQAQLFEGYFENGLFYVEGKTMRIPERQRVFITILDDTINEQLDAMDEFIEAIKTSNEDVPEFERLKLREVEI